jgi:hypothetical protein
VNSYGYTKISFSSDSCNTIRVQDPDLYTVTHRVCDRFHLLFESADYADPSSLICPLCMTKIRSAPRMVERLWAITIEVLPFIIFYMPLPPGVRFQSPRWRWPHRVSVFSDRTPLPAQNRLADAVPSITKPPALKYIIVSSRQFLNKPVTVYLFGGFNHFVPWKSAYCPV